jgi:hypothetical protein
MIRRIALPLLALVAAFAPACGGGDDGSTSDQATSSSTPANCRAGALHVTAGKGGVATGHVSSSFLIRNSGETPCTLRGYPNVTLLDANGKPLDVAVKQVASDFFGPVPDRAVSIPAGGQASFRLVTSNGGEDVSGCPKTQKARVELPNSPGTQVLRFAAVACPGTITVSRIGRGRSAS